MSVFKPFVYQKNIFSIDYDKLKEKGFSLLIFDLDNTIVEIGEELPNEKVCNLFNRLHKDFKLVIASNNIQRKVKKIAEYLNCDYLYSMMKPTKRIKKFLDKRYNIDNNKVAIIGDQIVTDIFVGNRLGIYTILVDPLSNVDFKITSLNRFLEKKIMKRIGLKKGEYYEKE